MQKLIAGYLRFHEEEFPKWKDHFHLLSESQAPKVLFITCADSRVVPNLIFQAEPGDLFLCRNAGNVVPPAGERAGGVSATIEYAVEVLRVEHIIICGHSDCGAVRAAARPELAENLPAVRPWLRYVEEAQARHMPEFVSNAGDVEGRFHDRVCANVLGQLDNLRTHAAVRRGTEEGRLAAHGMYYDILTGTVEVYEAAKGGFAALEASALRVPAADRD